MRLNLREIYLKNISQIRYIASGIFFTITGPSLFILLSSFISPKIAIIFSEIFLHFIRFQIITKWVFQSRINKASMIAYTKATIPLFICNFILVNLLVSILGTIRVAILIATFSATIGFIWNKICYRKTSKIKKS